MLLAAQSGKISQLILQVRNRLPKKPGEGVALNRFVSQHQLFRLGVIKKQTILKFIPKISLVGALLFYLSGYQPVLAIPPLRQSLAYAQFSQQQEVKAEGLVYPFLLPHPGYISTHFSTFHPGTDIATGLGMPIHPVSPGKIVEASMGFFGLGHFVVVEHEQNFKSIYGHMGRIFVKVGDKVTSSSTLGEVGLTGHTSGPHTHLEITKNGSYIDPETLLPKLPNWPQASK